MFYKSCFICYRINFSQVKIYNLTNYTVVNCEFSTNNMTSNSQFLFCAAGIFISYFYFGILQEKVTRGKYLIETVDENGEAKVINEKFTYALSLVFIACFVNYLFAKGILYAKPQGEDKTPKNYYISCSLTYLLAMVCSNMALQWVPYPTQVMNSIQTAYIF